MYIIVNVILLYIIIQYIHYYILLYIIYYIIVNVFYCEYCVYCICIYNLYLLCYFFLNTYKVTCSTISERIVYTHTAIHAILLQQRVASGA